MFPTLSKTRWVKILPSLKLGDYLLKRQRIDGSFGTLEETYWAVNALAHLNMLDSIDKDSLLKFILTCKRINGFSPSSHESEVDLHSIFYAINILFLIEKQNVLSIEEFETIFHNIFNFQKKDGGFSHCNLDFCPICRSKSSLKSTFFAIFCLKLLYDIKTIDEQKILKYLSRQSSKKGVQQVFRLLSLLQLNHIEDIDEASITYLINFQQTDGSFGSLEYSFWILYCLDSLKRLRNINKGKLFEYFRAHQKEDKRFQDETTGELIDHLNIKETAWATLGISILWNELIDYIEHKLLIQIYRNDKVLIEKVAEDCFVRSDLIIYLIKNLMKYNWFNVEIRDSIDFIKAYVQKFDAISKRIAIAILKYIADQNFVNLSELAKNYSGTDYSKALERVIAVANELITKKLIIGEIKWHKRFFRVTGFLYGSLPGKIIVKLNQIPYHEVLLEKEQVPIEKKRIQEVIERIKPLTEKIKNEIDNLLDINEVELAKEHLKKDITTALDILNTSNQNIEINISKFQYLDGEYSRFLMQDWVKLYHKTKESILEIEKEYLEKIRKKERIVKILKDLEAFQEYVQNQLNHITDELNNTLKLFQIACEEKTLEQKKDEIKKRLDSIAISVERITPQLRTQATNLSKASIELRRSQETSQLDALQPLEKWLESMWMKKRKNTIKIINDLKAHLNAREELKENIKNRKELFNLKLRELSHLIDSKIDSTQFMTANTMLNEKTEEILKFLSESNQYILNFIQDTDSYLEGFQLTVEDIFEEWSKITLENMRKELNSVKSDLEVKILSKKELDQNSQLDKIIEKNMLELKNAAESMEKNLLYLMEIRKLSEITKEMKQKISNIEELMKFCNRQIQNFVKKTSQEFPNFPETSQVTTHKWTLFKESFKRELSLITDRIKEKLLINMIFTVAPIFHGGRVKLDYLASKLNLKKKEIEDRIVYLISMGKLEGQFDKDHEEVIPLTDELKELLKFERMIKQEMDNLKAEYERTMRLFETSCRKKQLDTKVTEEIIGRTREILSQKYNTEVIIDKQIKQLPNHIDLQILLDKWYQQKFDVEQNLTLITQKISQRLKFQEKIEQFVRKIRTKINEIADPIEIKLNSKEFLEADKLLSKLIGQIEPELKRFDKELKLHVDKISNDLPRFDLVVADLITQWSKEKTKLKTDLSDLNSRLKEKINDGLIEKYKQELNELIHHCNVILNNFLDNYEKDIDLKIQKGDLTTPIPQLQNFHKRFDKMIKDCEQQIHRFIDIKSKFLKAFKDAANPIVIRWDLSKQELQKAFQETYLQLENQLLVKYLQTKQIAYETSKLELSIISKDFSKLKIKKNELRQRFASLIAAGKLGGKLDPTTDEYIFPVDRIEDAQLERPPSLLTNETPSLTFKNRLWDKISDIFRKWYPVIGSFGSIAGASVTIYSLTGLILPSILLPSIVFPTLFIYVLYTHYRRKGIDNK